VALHASEDGREQGGQQHDRTDCGEEPSVAVSDGQPVVEAIRGGLDEDDYAERKRRNERQPPGTTEPSTISKPKPISMTPSSGLWGSFHTTSCGV